LKRTRQWESWLLSLLLLAGCASEGGGDDPEADAEPDAEQSRPEPEPVICNPDYNLTLGRGEMHADLAGHDEETEFASTDVETKWDPETDDPARGRLDIEAIWWCQPRQQKAALLITCRATPEELAALPLTLDVKESFILGISMCAVSFTMRSIYKKKPTGSITLQTWSEDGGATGTFGFALGEMTDPDHKIEFSSGTFTAVPDA